MLDSLNEVQCAAVQHESGPVLIHAGAGSGKTRVLTHRVAYLLENLDTKPWEILAVTFTNKAAREMKERILDLIGLTARDIWVGTFHSICARILRVEAEKLGYKRNFMVFDRDDQIKFVKEVMRDHSIPEKDYAPANVVRIISGAKSALVGPDDYVSMAKEPLEEAAALVYGHYQKRLKANNTMDFDDLLTNPIYLFEADAATLERYQDKFKYLLVDEYQDTNKTQYQFLKHLVAKHKNLCVVGDDDQSIYRWRGADIQNILNIEKDYPGCKVFRLEQNYRSTKNILEVANSVVHNNRRRRDKSLWTNNDYGDKVAIIDVVDQIAEAKYVSAAIKSELAHSGRNFRDFVILYRTNSQSRVLEEALRNSGIPYMIVGGVRFYERKEIKDVLAYLRLICNPLDSISFKRIINVPLRGIGDTSLAKLEEFARHHALSLLQAAGRASEIDTISPRIQKNIFSFFELIDKYSNLKEEFSPGELARALVEEIGILRTFKEVNTEEARSRSDNVVELLTAIANYNNELGEYSLEAFLEEVALIADVDTWDDRSNAVTLMTVHSAKGLEFPVVYITGLEEGLFPLTRTFESEEELEEERRLFYVGATRAREKLSLTWASRRLKFGEYFQNLPSRFIDEIEPALVERIDLRQKYPARTPWRGARSSRNNVPAPPKYDDFSQDLPQLYVGSEVKHRKFGIGRVKAIQGNGENLKVVVRFQEAGERKLVAKFANLEVIE